MIDNTNIAALCPILLEKHGVEDLIIWKKPTLFDKEIIRQYFKYLWIDSVKRLCCGGCPCMEDGDWDELVIYKNIESETKWINKGWSKPNSKTAVLVCMDENTIQITTGEQKILAELSAAIVNNSFIFPQTDA